MRIPRGSYPQSTFSISLRLRFATVFRSIWTLWKEFLQAFRDSNYVPAKKAGFAASE
jgi:hypothetical protein